MSQPGVLSVPSHFLFGRFTVEGAPSSTKFWIDLDTHELVVKSHLWRLRVDKDGIVTRDGVTVACANDNAVINLRNIKI